MSKVAIYVRVSTTDKQDYKRQITELEVITNQHGFKSPEIYAESISGYKSKDERPELSRLLNDVHSFSCIYISEISRIGRNPKEIRRLVDEITDSGCNIYIQNLQLFVLDKNGKISMLASIILTIMTELANLEAETFKTRSKSGLLQSARDGKAGGSKNYPYGFKKDDKGYLVIDDEESIVIKKIFEQYKSGNGIKFISNIMNNEKIPTRSQKNNSPDKIYKFKIPKEISKIKWSDKQIHDILNNTIYKGQRRFKNSIIPITPIISEELFDSCQDIMKNKTHRNYLTTYTYLLKDICHCGICGRNYFARYKPELNGDKVYICSSRLVKSNNCGNAGVNISLVESALYNEIKSTERVLKYIGNIQERKNNLNKEIEHLKSQLLSEQNSINSKANEQERLLDLYLSGSLTKNKFQEIQTKIESETKSISDRISILKKEIRLKEEIMQGLSSTKTTKKMLFEARNNRSELKSIFQRLIHKCEFIPLDKDNMHLKVWLKPEGFIFEVPVELVLDIGGLRRKPKVYRYRSFENQSWINIEDILQVE
jgi:site-specific DNA recombinase